MEEREVFSVDVTGDWIIEGKTKKNLNLHFVFYAEPNIREATAIKNQTAELLGGRNVVAELESQAFAFYEKHLEFNHKKHGEENFKTKLTELESMNDAQTDDDIAKFNKLYKQLYKNKYYEMYAGLMEDRVRVGEYAFLEVMCKEKPEGFEFFTQKEQELKKVVKEVEIKKKFFRTQTDKTETDSAA